MEPSSSPSANRVELVVGRPENNAGNFRAIFHLLARDKLYGKLPLHLFPEVDFAMQRGNMLCARGPQGLLGLCAWKHLSEHRARKSIAERRLPAIGEAIEPGEAVLLTLIAGSVSGVVSVLARRTFALHRGRIVLYERHLLGGTVASRFTWVDKLGVRLGSNLT